MTTAQTLIDDALLDIGAIEEGDSADATKSAHALRVLNRMLEQWSIERQMVYQIVQESFAVSATQASRTIGSGGNFNTVRPNRLEDGCYFTISSIDYPLTLINYAQWDSIPLKTLSASPPTHLYYDNAYPLGILHFYPVPSAAGTLYINSWKTLAAVASLSTTVAFPPAYELAIVSNLSKALCRSYGVTVTPDLQETATTSRRAIKSLNAPRLQMTLPSVLRGRQRSNIFEG